MFNRGRDNGFFGGNQRQFLERPPFFGQQLPHFNNQQLANQLARQGLNFGNFGGNQGGGGGGGNNQGGGGGGNQGGGNRDRQNFIQQNRGGPHNNNRGGQGPQGGGNGGQGGFQQRRNMQQHSPGQQRRNNGPQGGPRGGQQNTPNKQQNGGNAQNFQNNKRKLGQNQNQNQNKTPQKTPQRTPQKAAAVAAAATPAAANNAAAKKAKIDGDGAPVGSFKVAVTHPNHPVDVLTDEKLAATEKLILQKLIERPDDAPPVSFYKCEKKEGYLLIITANDKSRDWLLAEMPNIKPDGMELTACLAQNLPRIHKVQLTLPASDVDDLKFDNILKILQRMNANLDTKMWKCIDTKENAGTEPPTKTLTIRINEPAKKQLLKIGHKLFYKFGQVVLKTVIEPATPTAAAAAPATPAATTQNGQAKAAETNGKVVPKAEQK